MPSPVYLGDELAGAGLRLAGVDVRVPERGSEATAFAEATQCAPLVLVSAAVAAKIPEARMRAATGALAPLVVIVPDLATGMPLPDLAARLRRQLGLES